MSRRNQRRTLYGQAGIRNAPVPDYVPYGVTGQPERQITGMTKPFWVEKAKTNKETAERLAVFAQTGVQPSEQQ